VVLHDSGEVLHVPPGWRFVRATTKTLLAQWCGTGNAGRSASSTGRAQSPGSGGSITATGFTSRGPRAGRGTALRSRWGAAGRPAVRISGKGSWRSRSKGRSCTKPMTCFLGETREPTGLGLATGRRSGWLNEKICRGPQALAMPCCCCCGRSNFLR
jgi:hypothetical protein